MPRRLGAELCAFGLTFAGSDSAVLTAGLPLGGPLAFELTVLTGRKPHIGFWLRAADCGPAGDGKSALAHRERVVVRLGRSMTQN